MLGSEGGQAAASRIPTSRDNMVTLGRPGDAMKRMRMGEREPASPGWSIPNASGSILACRGDKAVIGRPSGIFDAFRVACQGEQKVTRLSVPNAGGSVLAGGGDAEAIRGPGDAPDGPRGIGEGKDGFNYGEVAHER